MRKVFKITPIFFQHEKKKKKLSILFIFSIKPLFFTVLFINFIIVLSKLKFFYLSVIKGKIPDKIKKKKLNFIIKKEFKMSVDVKTTELVLTCSIYSY